MQTESVPVTLLTGFLGAGKSTLLSRILKEEHGMRVAVIQNEKNNIGIEKITAVDEAQSETDVLEWIDLPNGCACCAVKDDLVQTLEMLIAKGRFEHILIELSGLADPSLLAQIFWTDEMLECPFYLDAVVCVADARHICDHLANTVEAPNQIAFADVILLNKMDLVSESAAAAAMRQISAVNSQAKVLSTVFGETDLRQLLNVKAFDAKQSHDTFVVRQQQQSALEHHTATITSCVLQFSTPLNKRALESFLADLLWEPGKKYDVLRLKGLLSFKGEENLFALQAVREIWQLEETRQKSDGTSQFVLIGRNMQIEEWKEAIARSCE